MKFTKMTLAAIAAAGFLAGCGGSDGGVSEAPKAAVESKNAHGQKISGIERRTSEGRQYQDFLDVKTQFQYGDSTHQKFKDLFWSKADPANKELLAQFVSPEFRSEQSSFKRDKMLEELAPAMESYLAQARQVGDIAILTDRAVPVYGYNKETQSFPIYGDISFPGIVVLEREHSPTRRLITAILAGNLMGSGTGDKENMVHYKVTGEEAEKIDTALASLRDSQGIAYPHVRVKGYVAFSSDKDATDTGGDLYSIVAADALELVNPKTGETILTLTNQHMPGIIEITKSDLSAVGPKTVEAFMTAFNIKPEKELPMGVN